MEVCVRNYIHSRFLTATAAVAIGVSLAVAPAASFVPSAAASTTSGPINAKTFLLPLHKVGEINLSEAAKAEHRTKVTTSRQGAPISRAAAARSRARVADEALLSRRPKGTPKAVPNPATTALTSKNVPGEIGFSAMGEVQQAGTNGGFDLEPPDQGLCAGGGYVMEFINNALAVYTKNGEQVVAPIGSANAFLQPTTDFFSDPRCYYDAPTHRWFYQEFIVGTVSSSGKVITPSTQFEAVSNGSDPTGSYTIYSWDTTDAGAPSCPCFGDYDNLGADANGIYVATDEFGIQGGYNGVVIYAISKALLENIAATGIVPPVIGYRIPTDPFGATEIVAPASTPPGGRYAPGTEYFIESNPDALSDNHLMVYAMHDTSALNLESSGPPSVFRTEVTTQGYAQPPDAAQKPGPHPLGQAFSEPINGLQTDFDAEMEPTYTNGQLYAQLDTATASGTSAADWFILKPTFTGTNVTASVVHQGSVSVKGASLLYPYTAVDGSGNGYLLFALSGTHNYPSPAYIRYNGATGPTGPVILATSGAAPEDGFTCYAAFVGPNFGGCRWGDYSMGAFANGRVYMATEMIPPGFRDLISNFGTWIWSAPPS
jgi:hypothetical protein